MDTGGTVGPNQIPLQQQVFWLDCVWNTDVGRFIAPPASQDPFGLQKARDFWNLVLTTYCAQRQRHFFVYVDRGANGPRSLCGSSSGPAGCVPSRGKGNRPTVVCRNDGLAFPGVTFTAAIQ